MKDYPYVPGWRLNKENNKPAIKHSVLMLTTHGVAEGEWDGNEWVQYRWSCKVKDSDVLYWIHLEDLTQLEKEGDSLQQEQPEVDLVAELEHHLATTPNEQLEKEWKELEPWNNIGPTVQEFLYGKQPEVDLNEEIDRFLKSEESTTYENAGSYKVAVKDLKKIARHFYELGFNEKSDAPKIKGWVARDKSGDLYFFHYDCKPHRTDGIFHSECSEDVFHLDNSMFSGVDWLTEPIKVELTISRVKTE